MAEIALLDAGPLVALLDRSDADHTWASDKLKDLHAPLHSCAAVIGEAMFVLRRCHAASDQLRTLLDRGLILPVTEDAALWARALTLMKRYENVPMSFDDACLVAISETQEETRIFTLDRDFLIYRRNEREVLSLLSPFES